ncbi:MAG TPA: SLBB domain-containing protein [Candidatus Acidoferrum sp.]|jgi:protein involved in polysaccharide export with SLBB domain
MFGTKKFAIAIASFSMFAICLPAHAQDPNRQSASRDPGFSVRLPDSSELAKDNLDRVAATAAQLQTVLLKDPGILVELKRWIAKEAADNGQIIEDSALTDQAIFERLTSDIPFRSIATRLVQRYGYLLPTVNPDSDSGKQKEFVIRERARRQVQIEAQEDAAANAEIRRAATEQETQNCENGREDSCAESTPSKSRRQTSAPAAAPSPDQNSTPLAPELPPMPSSPILRANNSSPDSTGGGSPDFASALQQLAGQQSGGGQDGMSGSDPKNSLLARSMAAQNTGASGMASGSYFPLSLDASSLGEVPDKNIVAEDAARKSLADRALRSRDTRRRAQPEDLMPVSMVHRPNPYADIPALYDMYVQASSRQTTPERFGLDIFRNGSADPDIFPMDLPAGADYIVGPGDGLSIDLWGGVSQRISRTVDREGRISLPESGPVLVSGHSLGDVQQTIQQVLRVNFRDISADVSLSRLRTIRVYIVGDVAEPGAYDISSLSTPLNALFVAGGVTQRGSLRSLKHYRGKQLLEEVDAYDLLLHGVRGEMARLDNGDTLLVTPIGPQVTVEGMVRRPAIYELHGEKTLEDVLDLAGGILPAAALQHIEVQRLEAHTKRSMLSLDISPNSDTADIDKQLASFKVQDGDQIHIFPIAPYNESAIYLQGHVLRPGRYSYSEGMKLTDVIKSYGDLLPEPAGHYAEIVRLNAPDFRPSVESFDLTAALANPETAPKLQAHDTVRIFGRFDFEPAPEVWIGGEVRAPGKYRTSGQVRLRDAIYLAGGLSPDASLDSAQLFRTQPDGTLKILSVHLGDALAGKSGDNILLESRDRLLIHRNLAKIDPTTVYAKGDVAKPGRYPLTTNMHIEDLIRVAGGLKRSADPVNADLTRYAEGDPAQATTQSMPVVLSAALEGDPNENKLLRDGDVLTIRQTAGWNNIAASVTVRGEIQHGGQFGIRPGERLSSLIERAGGFGPDAYPYGAVLMRRDVRELEMTSRTELVRRVQMEQVFMKTLPENDVDQKNAKLTAIAETQTTLDQLQANLPIGRVIIHIQSDVHAWRNTVADVPLVDGDVLVIPKKANYITATGQVFNPTAVSYRPGRSAKWYLSQAGGLTQLANKDAAFVIRADGSVIASKNNSGWFSGDPLSTTLRPGDSIVVPEKAPKVGGRNWQNLFQAGQLAASAALAVAYIHP